MATVTTKERPFNHEEMQRKVRNPLHLVRKYIRRYIILEGVALTILFASIFFWIGLAIDYGLYKLDFDWRNKEFIGTEIAVPPLHVHGVDWLLELNDIDLTGITGLTLRGMILGAIVIGVVLLHLLGDFLARQRSTIQATAKGGLEDMFIFVDATQLFYYNVAALVVIPLILWLLFDNLVLVVGALPAAAVVRQRSRRRVRRAEGGQD